MGVCNCSMFCCTLLYVYSSIAIILMGKRELIALLNLSSWCLVMVERLSLAVPRGCLQFVIVVFPDHTHLLFWNSLHTVCSCHFQFIVPVKVLSLISSTILTVQMPSLSDITFKIVHSLFQVRHLNHQVYIVFSLSLAGVNTTK